ncbi:MAG: disulfide bond formation protein B [Hyphomicrobiaceae bacterium]|nr:disulfide bond formation protein B [Hyphomicrobiaceae bacterium]
MLNEMLARFNAKPLAISAALLFALSVAIIITALGFEHIGGYKPCPLCLIERKAWYIAVPLALLALLLYRLDKLLLVKLVLAAIALMFLVNAGLAGYHAGVEWKWWEGPTSCTGDHLEQLGGGAGGLLEALKQTKVVRCDIAQFRLFGLSFSGYNVLASLFAALIASLGIASSRRGNL